MPIEIHSAAEADLYEQRVLAAANTVVEQLRQAPGAGIDVLRRIKFEECGRHPLDDRPLNLIEQVNQTFTYLASLQATKQLILLHPNAGGFRLNLGPEAGSDVEDPPGLLVAAEVFAAVDPQNNRKLAKDLSKVSGTAAQHKYVFFLCPAFAPGRRSQMDRDGVQVWALSM